MDRQIDDYCEGKMKCVEVPIELVNARRKWNEEIESISENSRKLLDSGRKTRGLLTSDRPNEVAY